MGLEVWTQEEKLRHKKTSRQMSGEREVRQQVAMSEAASRREAGGGDRASSGAGEAVRVAPELDFWFRASLPLVSRTDQAAGMGAVTGCGSRSPTPEVYRSV